MAKLTLLDMTQQILSNMSSDEVNSIGDTTESMQVANIIKQKYLDIVSRSALPEHDQFFQLTASTDPDLPVLMYVPDYVNKIEEVKYFDSNVLDNADSASNFEHDVDTDITNTVNPATIPAPGYKYVTILPIRQFVETINTFNPTDSNVVTYTFNNATNSFPANFTFYCRNDGQPNYCAIISNYYVLFDRYDATQDNTLQSSKTMCFGQVAPSFSLDDNFIPDLDDKEFPLLLNEAKALAFYELKQMPHQKAEQEIKRQWSSIQKNKAEVNKPSYFDRLPDFGRTRYERPTWYGKRY